MRRILITLLSALLVLPAAGQGGKVTASIEWGGGITIGDFHHYNYQLDDGYRMTGNDWIRNTHAHAFWLIGAGYDFHPCWNISVYAGYEGIGPNLRVYPVTLRLTRCFNGNDRDGWFAFADGGAGISDFQEIPALLLRPGGGYRLALSPRATLDLVGTLRLSMRNPDLFDPDSTQPIPSARIASNRLYSSKISLSVILSFH